MTRTQKESRYVGSFASPREYGWKKITEVSVHRDHDETERTTYEAVQMRDDQGDWFHVELEHGETAEDLANSYRARGWTDSRCTYMGKAT